MNHELNGKRVVILLAARYEDDEVTGPARFLADHGAEVRYVGLEKGQCHGKKGTACVEVQHTVAEIAIDDLDALIIPGGAAPEALRQHAGVLRLVTEAMRQAKPVAAICHGPQVLVSAGLLRGRKLTAYAGIRDDLINAGAHFVDAAVVVDDNLITSRTPADLPQFNAALLEAVRRFDPQFAPWAAAAPSEVIEMAIYKEVQAQRRYAEMAAHCQDKLAKAKFKYLAETERGHREQLVAGYMQMMGGKKPRPKPIGVDKPPVEVAATSNLDVVLTYAIAEEQASQQLYTFLAGRARTPEVRRVFQQLADEEQAHKMLLEQELTLRAGRAPASSFEETPWFAKDEW